MSSVQVKWLQLCLFLSLLITMPALVQRFDAGVVYGPGKGKSSGADEFVGAGGAIQRRPVHGVS